MAELPYALILDLPDGMRKILTAREIFCNIVENMELCEQIETIYILEQYGYQ